MFTLISTIYIIKNKQYQSDKIYPIPKSREVVSYKYKLR